jgi:hypothetical protein
MTITALQGPQTTGLLPGQGRWFLTLHQRLLSLAPFNRTAIIELDGAHGRQLTQAWNTPAVLQFSIDGRSQAAAYIQELTTEVVAWRRAEYGGNAVPYFRGTVAQTEDEISADRHTVTVTCHDAMATLMRRYLIGTSPVMYTNVDQDDIVSALVAAASSMAAPFNNTSFLPVQVALFNQQGGFRGKSGQIRTRTYFGGQSIGQAIDDLSRVQGGFDWAVVPEADNGVDWLYVFYPYASNSLTTVLQYGSTVSALTRTVNSADYANYYRSMGNNGQSDPTLPQLVGSAWNTDATDATHGIGLWQATDDASDVTIAQTLTDTANGDLLLNGQLVPAYTLTLRPGVYQWGKTVRPINIGDALQLVIQSGRLNVSTTVRVLGLVFDIGDDGEENVEVTVGRPTRNLADLLWEQNQAIQALNRR